MQRYKKAILAFGFLILLSPSAFSSEQETLLPVTDGESVYDIYCASCHAEGLAEAPTVNSLRQYQATQIVAALENGVMMSIGNNLTSQQKLVVSEFLSQRKDTKQTVSRVDNSCSTRLNHSMKLTSAPTWKGWGANLYNNRHQNSADIALTDKNIARLKLKWVFASPNATRARSQPAVTSDVVFMGSQDGVVYALDTQTGCEWWSFKAESEVRTAISIGLDKTDQPRTIYFGDFKTNVYSVDARTGSLRWKKKIGKHPVATITGSPKLYKNRLYIPLSATEGLLAVNPEYPCCTFRGSVVALDTLTGDQIWQSYIVPKPSIQGKNKTGRANIWGPSGAPIWGTPTIDVKRGLLYVGSGENYTMPVTDTSDAVIAMKLDTGKIEWVSQVTKNDAWNLACYMGQHDNCPSADGPDFDIGAPPILTRLADGTDIILVGQKSGVVYGMDPNQNGKVLWRTRVGQGGYDGGVHWGMTVDNSTLYVGVSDYPSESPAAVGAPFYGLRALDPKTGDIIWSKAEPVKECEDYEFKCYPSLSAAITSTPGLVYAGGLDGIFRIYSMSDRTNIWEYDTKRDYKTVNGHQGFGGSIDSDGPVVLGNMVFINSGYNKFGEIGGNVLLVFSIDGK